MGSRVRIRLFDILHFVRDLLLPLLKNSKSGSHMVGTASLAPRWPAPLGDYPGASPTCPKPKCWNDHGLVADLSQTWGIQSLTMPTVEKVSFHVKIYFIFVWDWSATVGRVNFQVHHVQLSRYLSGTLAMSASLPFKVFHRFRNCPRLGRQLVCFWWQKEKLTKQP